MRQFIGSVLIVAILCVFHVRGQIFTPEYAVNADETATQVPGDAVFDFEFRLDRAGSTNETSTCTITFSSPSSIAPVAVENCTELTSLSYQCPINWAVNETFEVRNVINGNIGVSGCSGDSWTVDYNCVNPGSSDNVGQFAFTLGTSSADISVALLDVDVNSTVVDFSIDPQFTVITQVVNDNDCDSNGIRCILTYPAQFVNEDNPGLVDLRTDAAASTVTDQLCGLNDNVLTCPSITEDGFNLNQGEMLEIVTVFDLTGNGTLNFTVECNATGLVDFSDVSDELTYTGINVPPPDTGDGITSDDSDDLIENTAIPLAIFGFVMILLCTAIAVIVVAYIIYSKAVAEESL